MPYLLRSRGLKLEVRDGVGTGDPLYVVRPGVWSPFENLPRNVPESGDGDLEVRFVDSIEGVEKAPIVSRPVKAPHEKAAETKPREEEPKKRKPRVR